MYNYKITLELQRGVLSLQVSNKVSGRTGTGECCELIKGTQKVMNNTTYLCSLGKPQKKVILDMDLKGLFL